MNETYICAHCGQTFSRDDMTEVASGKLVCQDCLEEHFEQCNRCGEWHPIEDDDLQPVNVRYGWRHGTEYWCPDCVIDYAFECSDCGELCARDMMELDEAGLQICYNCSDNWRHCESCGTLVREDDGHWDDDDAFLCDSCWSRRESEAIHNYYYKPDPIFGYRRNEDAATALTFGLELEVDGGGEDNDKASKVLEAADGRCYCKHDGSLDQGFEIVSHPGTLAHHQYEMHWANICRVALKEGYKSHETDTCGLHIHVGRTQLGSDSYTRRNVYLKLVVLMDKLSDEMTKFSRRKDRQLNDWARMPSLDHSCPEALADTARRYVDSGDRYQAVNFNNGGTVEFRIFRGTLKRDTIIAAIQIVHNLCKFAMTHSMTECAEANFVDIVNTNPFKELLAYSVSRKLIAPVQATA